MITDDGYNFYGASGSVKFLGVDDIIPPGSYIRDLIIDEMNPYLPDDHHHAAWHRIEDRFSGWIGKTYRDYLNFGNDCINTNMHHEIIVEIGNE